MRVVPRLRHRGARWYYAALFLCPPRFRREFAAEMAQDVDDALQDLRLESDPDLLAFWMQIGRDLVQTIVGQWFRTGLPLLLPSSALGAIVVSIAAVQALARRPLIVPAAPADRDLMTLIVLTGVVLGVIVSTIFFIFWFSQPLLRRHRR